MKKTVYGALALLLMISVISCRDNNTDNAENAMEEPAVEQEVTPEVDAVTEDTLEVEESAAADSLQTSTPAAEETAGTEI